MKKAYLYIALIAVALLFSGCNMRTIDQMYHVPKRSESYTNLQSQIDKAMTQAEFNAPISGENRQSVQMADLDGDGESEYLVFAKSNGEKPLHVYIFDGEDGKFTLADTLSSAGAAFQQVEYVQIDGRKGMEVVIGRQVSDQVSRTVNVYSMVNGKMQEILSANTTRFVCQDMDRDGNSEIIMFRPSNSVGENGIAEMYRMHDGEMKNYAHAMLSVPSDKIRRIVVSKLASGESAVLVAGDLGENTIVTDVFSVIDGAFSNIISSGIQTSRDEAIYADDIDDDGVMELPALITMNMPEGSAPASRQYLIRWYALESDGTQIDKMFTYHNYDGGWYVRLDSKLAGNMAVVAKGSSCEFYVWDQMVVKKIMTVHALTGQKREEQAVINNRFVLHRTESTVYCGELEVASAAYGMNKDTLINAFQLIQQDWYTGET